MKYLPLIGLWGCLGLAANAGASERDPLFRDHTVLKAVLTAPIAQTYAQRNSDVRLYHPGQWTYIDESVRRNASMSLFEFAEIFGGNTANCRRYA